MKPGTAAVLFGVTLLIGGAFLANSTILAPASSPASAGGGVTPSPAPLQENLLTATLEVDGMWCGSCSYMVTKALVRTPGVVDAKVSMRTKTAIVTYDQTKTDTDALVAATTNYGYPSRVIVQESAGFKRREL